MYVLWLSLPFKYCGVTFPAKGISHRSEDTVACRVANQFVSLALHPSLLLCESLNIRLCQLVVRVVVCF